MADTLNQRIRDLRKSKGLTQLELAQQLNVTDKAVSKWESNDGNPDIFILPKLAEILDVTIDYLLTGKKVETIGLDDMDAKKRREYIIKHDDVANFIKYKYDEKNEYYHPRWYINGTNVHILSTSFWDSIFKNKAYNIFKHCFSNTVEVIKKQLNSSTYNNSNVKCFIEILSENYKSTFIDFCLREDTAEWLEIIGLKYVRISDDETEGAIIKSSLIDKIIKNRKKAPECFNYLIRLDFITDKSKLHKIQPLSAQNELPYYLVKNGCLEELRAFIDSYKKHFESLDFCVDRDYRLTLGHGIVSSYCTYNSDWHSNIGYYLQIDEKTIRLCVSLGLYDLAKSLIDYNNDFNNYTKNKFGYDAQAFVLTENEFDVLCVELDGKLSEVEKIKKQIKVDQLLDIKLLDRLFEISTNDKTFEYAKKIIAEKPITHYEYVLELAKAKRWKELFAYTVDFDFGAANKLLIEKKYVEAVKNILDNMRYLRHNSSAQNKVFSINKDFLDYKDIFSKAEQGARNCTNYDKNATDDSDDDIYKELVANTITKYICTCFDDFREKWINLKKEKLERFKLVDKMNHISNEITREYIDGEISKGNVEIVIIKLCAKLQAVLSKKFNRDDDLFVLLKEYCDKDLHWTQDDGWGYDEYCSDDEQIRILNKLRIQRNNIAHPDKGAETLTAEELEKAVDYVFKIREERE